MLTNTWSSQAIQKNNTGNIPLTKDHFPDFSSPIKTWDYQIPINKYGVSRHVNSPDIEDNLWLNHFVFSLLRSDPFAIIKMIQKEIDTNPDLLELSKEINFLKFFSFSNPIREENDISQIIEEIKLRWIEEYYSLLLKKIFNWNLLRRSIRNKIWTLKNNASSNNIANKLRMIIFFITQWKKNKWEDTISRQLIILLKTIELWLENIDHFYHSDIVSAALWYSVNFSVNGNILNIHFSPRDASYLTLGNDYWDCTAPQRKKQVDTIRNIFWTKASWILNPFYQILEVQNKGRPIMKVHLILCVFRGKITLCIDAIETPLWMREYSSNNNIEWSENLNKDTLFKIRFEILDKVIDLLKNMAQDMGISTILVEEYSNTSWVRDWLQKYQQVFFYKHELREIYDGEIVDSIFYKLTWWLDIPDRKQRSSYWILKFRIND